MVIHDSIFSFFSCYQQFSYLFVHVHDFKWNCRSYDANKTEYVCLQYRVRNIIIILRTCKTRRFVCKVFLWNSRWLRRIQKMHALMSFKKSRKLLIVALFFYWSKLCGWNFFMHKLLKSLCFHLSIIIFPSENTLRGWICSWTSTAKRLRPMLRWIWC